MTEFAPATATALVGAAAASVVAWGAWISIGSSRLGPGWALAALERWRPFPWVLALLGAASIVLISPTWAGVGVVYVAGVTGWLSRTVRRRLLSVRDTFGEFDADVSGAGVTRRTGAALVAAAVALGGLAMWDITVRGWVGGIGLAIAVLSGAAGIALLRRPT